MSGFDLIPTEGVPVKAWTRGVELDEKALRQLRQRITVRYHLRPLFSWETEAYILHRLHVAGANSRPSFSRGALWWIYRYSRGVPRLVNQLCDFALLYCWSEEAGNTVTESPLRPSPSTTCQAAPPRSHSEP